MPNGACMLNCSVCGKTSGTSTVLAATTGASSLTFSQVLDKLVNEGEVAQAFKNKDFSSGILCTVCTYLVRTQDRLQKDVAEVKTLILSLFKNEHIELTSDKAQREKETSEVLYQQGAVGTEKTRGTMMETGKQFLSLLLCV